LDVSFCCFSVWLFFDSFLFESFFLFRAFLTFCIESFPASLLFLISFLLVLFSFAFICETFLIGEFLDSLSFVKLSSISFFRSNSNLISFAGVFSAFLENRFSLGFDSGFSCGLVISLFFFSSIGSPNIDNFLAGCSKSAWIFK
jgi:hypothetical protein